MKNAVINGTGIMCTVELYTAADKYKPGCCTGGISVVGTIIASIIMVKILFLELLVLAAVVSAVVVKHAGPFVGWSNSWAVEIEGGNDKATEIAQKHGFVNLGQVKNRV